MLAWSAFNIVGASQQELTELALQQQKLSDKILLEIDELGVETDGNGWRAKAYLYCLEVRCPESGWMVLLLPSIVISFGKQTIAELIPVASEKRYNIIIRSGVSSEQLAAASVGTLRADGRGQESYLIHWPDGHEFSRSSQG